MAGAYDDCQLSQGFVIEEPGYDEREHRAKLAQ
jgi:hypothetical protein